MIVNVCLIMKHLAMSLYLIAPTKLIGTTYPLVPFVGVNHHRSTVIFGCGIISHENIESYVWLLSTFSEAMIQKYPISMITDGDLAMQRAIRLVWPNSSHRLCIWHIE